MSSRSVNWHSHASRKTSQMLALTVAVAIKACLIVTKYKPHITDLAAQQDLDC